MKQVVTILFSILLTGMVVVFAIGYMFRDDENGWRYHQHLYMKKQKTDCISIKAESTGSC